MSAAVLVVCIGNICRSPMAQALLGAAVPSAVVTSAGICALVGQPADPLARQLLAARGLDLVTHQARQVVPAMCQQADLILTMDDRQRRHLEALYPWCRGKVFRLADALHMDIPDPYQKGRAAFAHAFSLIEAGIATWAKRIRNFT